MLAAEVFGSVVELKYLIIIFVVEVTGHGIYSFAMLFLSLDRMLTAVVGVGYTDTWNKGKTSVLVTVKWITMLLIGSFFCVHLYTANDISLTMKTLEYILYIDNILTFINFIILLVTYTVMLMKLWGFYRGGEDESQSSFLEMVWRSGYYIAILLIISHFLLMFIPGVFLALFNDGAEEDENGNFGRHSLTVRTNIMILISYLSDTMDAYIYIFKYSPVREMLFKIFSRLLNGLLTHNTVNIGVEPEFPVVNEVALVDNNDLKRIGNQEKRNFHLNGEATV